MGSSISFSPSANTKPPPAEIPKVEPEQVNTTTNQNRDPELKSWHHIPLPNTSYWKEKDTTSEAVPTRTMEGHRLFRFPKPQWMNSANTRTAGVYTSGALFALALHPHRRRNLLPFPPERLRFPHEIY